MPSDDTHNPWVIRTDFSDGPTWAVVKQQVAAPQLDPPTGMEFIANVKFVEEPALQSSSCEDIVHFLPTNYMGFVVFVVDAETIKGKEHPLLVIGFSPPEDTAGNLAQKSPLSTSMPINTFRAIPTTIQSIENNLSIANMDFEDFANAVDRDGIFRGFKG
jgi:hypothetical protein